MANENKKSAFQVLEDWWAEKPGREWMTIRNADGSISIWLREGMNTCNRIVLPQMLMAAADPLELLVVEAKFAVEEHGKR